MAGWKEAVHRSIKRNGHRGTVGAIFKRYSRKSGVSGTVFRPSNYILGKLTPCMQCSNYYRFLIETKQLQDGNYVIAPNGKPLYTFEKKLQDGTTEKRLRTHNKSLNQSYASGSDAALSDTNPTDDKLTKSTKRKSSSYKGTAKKARRRHRLTMTNDSSSDSEIDSYDNDASGNFVPRNYYKTRADKVQSEKYKQTRCLSTKEDPESNDPVGIQDVASADELECLLPGFIDPITLDQIERPAISKYGHIMGYVHITALYLWVLNRDMNRYDTWIRCLSNWQSGSAKNVCPITKQRLTKRDLGMYFQQCYRLVLVLISSLVLLTSENLHLYKYVIDINTADEAHWRIDFIEIRLQIYKANGQLQTNSIIQHLVIVLCNMDIGFEWYTTVIKCSVETCSYVNESESQLSVIF